MHAPEEPGKPIFVHIPRTAGSSVALALGLVDTHNPVPVRRRACPWWDEVPKFTIVRNPWDHAVAVFFYLQLWRTYLATRLDGLLDVVISGTSPHEEVVDAFREWVRLGFPEAEINGVCAIDQLKYMRDDEACEYRVFPFEGIGNTFENIKKWLGYPADLQLPHRNNTRPKDEPVRLHYREYYDDKTRALVAQRQARLIEMVSYEFCGVL